MISDITIGQYYKGDSFVHRLDPRMKIILTIIFIIMIFMCKNFLSLGLMILFVFISIIASGVPFKMFFKSLKPIVPIVIFTALLNMLYISDDKILLSFWIFNITEKGIYTAVFMAIRIICLIMRSSILTYTTVPTMLTDALEKLLSPLNVFHISVHSLAMMMTLALRFIPTLIEEIERIMNAQKARGADFETGSLMDRAKALIPILVPLFISAFRRADELAIAMECRCYQGGEGRTKLKQLHYTRLDFTAYGFGAVLILSIWLLSMVG